MSKKIAHLGTVTLDTKLATSQQLNADEILANGEDVAEMFDREHTYREMETRVKLEPEDNYILYTDDGTIVTANLSGVANGTRLFYNQTKLTEIPLSWKLDSITDGTSMCESCTNLTTFLFPLNSLSSGSGMFANCNLNEESVENILTTIPEYANGTHMLTLKMSSDAFEKFNEITRNYLMAPGTISYKGWEIASNAIITIPVEEMTTAIEEIVGEGKVIVDTVPTENKVIVHTDRVDDTQLEAVTALLEQLLPEKVETARYNHSIDIPWRDWPTGYTQVEYLENPKMAYLETNLEYSSEATIKIDFRDDQGASGSNGRFPYLFGGNASGIEAWSVGYAKDQTRWKWNNQRTYDFNNIIELGRRYLVELNKTGGYLDGIKKSSIIYSEWHAQNLTLFKMSTKIYTSGCKMYSAAVTENGKTLLSVVPCLDETGAPCMFDLVSRKPLYNQGEGDLLYPTETATYSLRRVLPDWGKLTEHGLRRLYHAPEGYTGELIDYALENGYKPIIEEPAPEEGYWLPQWRETEEEIILEWNIASNAIAEEEEVTNV